MNQTARIISIYTADTSGFCSALFEYGGMTVIHDASGCNSTYTTHDEPRWYDMDSMMYISGLTENDAVMGNDEKFVTDLCLAAEELKPKFIAICASALPAMVGVDMEAIAFEVESRTGIPAFEVKTNAMQSYITGAGNAFLELAKRFINPSHKSSKSLTVNVLGLTPLDFPLHGTTEQIEEWLVGNGYDVNSFVGMHHARGTDNLDEIVRLADANVSLVVSSIGMPLAKYLYEEYGIPYVIGTPYGTEFCKVLETKLREASESGENIDATKIVRGKKGEVRTAIIGESILSTSLAAALLLEKGIKARVLESVGDGELSVLRLRNEVEGESDEGFDLSCSEEDELEKEIEKSDVIIADPLFEPICRGKKFVRLPHMAFSGRCFLKEELQLINNKLEDINVKDSDLR